MTYIIKPEFIMLIGSPGTGKSVWIKKYVGDCSHWAILSTDAIFEEWGEREGIGYNEAFKRFKFKDVNAEFFSRMDRAFGEDMNVAWDQTNMTVKSRRGKLARVPSRYKKIAVAFEIPDKEVDRRLAKRAAETGKSIPEHVIRDMRSKYAPPTKDEGFDEIKVIRS